MRDGAVVEIVLEHAIRVDIESAAQRLLAGIDPSISLVLIGEATHGTHEFYRTRADLTRALIQHRGFTRVAWCRRYLTRARQCRFKMWNTPNGAHSSSASAASTVHGFARSTGWWPEPR